MGEDLTINEKKENKRGKKDKKINWYLDTPSKQTIVMVGSFVLLYVLCTMVLKFRFTISFYISEMASVNDPNIPYSVQLKGSDISQLVILNLAIPCIVWWVYRDSIKAAKENNPNFNEKIIFDYLILMLVALFIIGNSSHVIVNRINGKLLDDGYIQTVLRDNPTSKMADAYKLIYFYDEYVGHLGMMVPLFFIQMVLLRSQIHVPQEFKKLHPVEIALLIILGILNGVYNSYSLIEGQSNIVLLVMHLLLLPIIIWLILKKRYSIKNHPILLFLLLQIIGFTIYSFIWIILTGLKPYYPFTYQPSELEKSWFLSIKF